MVEGLGVMWWSWKLGAWFPVGLVSSPLMAPDTKEGLFMIVKPNESALAAKDRLRFEAVTKLSGTPLLASVEEDWAAIPVEASCSAIFSFYIVNWSFLISVVGFKVFLSKDRDKPPWWNLIPRLSWLSGGPAFTGHSLTADWPTNAVDC